MNPRRAPALEQLPTAADYIARALCPLLIMTLVGSLALFLQQAAYAGPHELRLRWLVFWCVLAMVGISRIAIERTPAYAGLYALLLGLVTYAFVNRFFEMPLVGWFMLALIWWCTNKLVYDCTLIDENEDASGEGLLGIAGIDETSPDRTTTPVSVRQASAKPPLWKTILTNARSDARRPHAPGLWVLYFSLAALPVFGLGQRFMIRRPADDNGMLFVLIYLVSATGLLLLTSFLGLRRHLRQRRLKMPAAMATRWILTGAGIIASVMVVSLLLPRPVPDTAARNINPLLPGRELKDDRHTDGGDAVREDVDNDEDGSATDRDDRGESNAGPGEETQGQPGEDGSGDAESRRSPAESAPAPANPLNAPMMRVLTWGLFAIVVAVFAWKHRHELAAGVRGLLESLRHLFRRNSKSRKHRESSSLRNGEAPTVSTRAFADLADPFAGDIDSMPPSAVVTRTFEALELWAEEQGYPRDRPMTACEFARELTHRHPDVKREINQLVALHAGWIYGDRAPWPDELPTLARLWEFMRSHAVR